MILALHMCTVHYPNFYSTLLHSHACLVASKRCFFAASTHCLGLPQRLKTLLSCSHGKGSSPASKEPQQEAPAKAKPNVGAMMDGPPSPEMYEVVTTTGDW